MSSGPHSPSTSVDSAADLLCELAEQALREVNAALARACLEARHAGKGGAALDRVLRSLDASAGRRAAGEEAALFNRARCALGTDEFDENSPMVEMGNLKVCLRRSSASACVLLVAFCSKCEHARGWKGETSSVQSATVVVAPTVFVQKANVGTGLAAQSRDC